MSWRRCLYAYDRYGNRWVPPPSPVLSQLTPTSQSAYNAATNRLTGGSNLYDAAGNHKQDGQGRTFAFDAENRQTSFSDRTTSGSYQYDGDGRRVRTTVGATTTTYVYDALGKLVVEYANPGTLAEPGVSYPMPDHLGSTRLVTRGTGGGWTLLARHYLPFGEEIPGGINSRPLVPGYAVADGVRQRFTGKERDGESGLDYFGARYFSGALARFTSPDPETADAQQAGPESWNGYAYARNNPLKYIDPDGRPID